MTPKTDSAPLDEPFPLRRYFFFWVFPALIVFALSFVYATSQSARSSTIEILLQLESRKVDSIAADVEAAAPDAWHMLLSGAPLDTSNLAQLIKVFGDEQRETQLTALKIYDRNRRTVFATEPDEMGRVEDKPELHDALERAKSSVLVERDAHGGAFYELYIPYQIAGKVAAVFELYEPISGFDALIWRVIRPTLVIPLSLFAIMLAGLGWLVSRTQREIDLRTQAIVSLRHRLETLLSRGAVQAMVSPAAQRPTPQTLQATIFYSDVRGFTGFAEHRPPADVIAFLNRIIGLQVEIIESNAGDIDKMIGDAILARFHGPERAKHAVATAVAIQQALESAGLPRGVAIGLCDGPVVAGLIGAGQRFDYTVIGDTVNSAARLCGLATRGEIVADSATAAMAQIGDFGAEERISVKGRTGAIAVRRIPPKSERRPRDP